MCILLLVEVDFKTRSVIRGKDQHLMIKRKFLTVS